MLVLPVYNTVTAEDRQCSCLFLIVNYIIIRYSSLYLAKLATNASIILFGEFRSNIPRIYLIISYRVFVLKNGSN